MPSSSSSAFSSQAAATRVGEPGAGLRVEVEPQLVGVLLVVGEVGPDVEAEAGEVDRPRDVGEVGGHERPRRRAVDGLHRRRLEPVGRVVGDALLEEVLLADAVREALHQHGPAAHRAHQRLLDRRVVAHEVELRDPGVREQQLARAGDPHLAPGQLEHLGFAAGHGHTLTARTGAATARASAASAPARLGPRARRAASTPWPGRSRAQRPRAHARRRASPRRWRTRARRRRAAGRAGDSGRAPCRSQMSALSGGDRATPARASRRAPVAIASTVVEAPMLAPTSASRRRSTSCRAAQPAQRADRVRQPLALDDRGAGAVGERREARLVQAAARGRPTGPGRRGSRAGARPRARERPAAVKRP